MSSREPTSDLAAAIGPRELCDYLAAQRWSRLPARTTQVAIYRSPGGGAVEVVVPLDTMRAGYADTITLAVRRISECEGRPAEQVSRDILGAAAGSTR